MGAAAAEVSQFEAGGFGRLKGFRRPLFIGWRICWILNRLRWFASFCMTRLSESIGRNGRRMRRQAGRMGFAAVFIDSGF